MAASAGVVGTFKEDYGASFADFDGDGWLDLFVGYGYETSGPNHLYLSNRDGTFQDVAASVGAGDTGAAATYQSTADFDNDHRTDLLIHREVTSDLLLRNFSSANSFGFDQIPFPNVSQASGSAWADADLDGLVDVAVTCLGGPKLFRNMSSAVFNDITEAVGISNDGVWCGMTAWCDYDRDGDPDLSAGGSQGTPLNLWRNLSVESSGTLSFSKVTQSVLHPVPSSEEEPAYLAWGDFDNDGYPDLCFTGLSGIVHLYRNRGDGNFDEVTGAAGIYAPLGTYRAPVFADFNNDGFLDIYIGNWQAPNLLYMNNKDGTFTESGSLTGADISGSNTMTLVGDYDNDGDMDIFLVHFLGDNVLLRNDLNSGNALEIDLQGTVSNGSGIGAAVTVQDSAGTSSSALGRAGGGIPTVQTREVVSGGGKGSGQASRVYFGTASSHVDLTIRWPSGRLWSVLGLPMNQRMAIQEAGVIPTPTPGPAAAKSWDLFN